MFLKLLTAKLSELTTIPEKGLMQGKTAMTKT